MKKLLIHAGKRVFVDVPPYVTAPVFIVWLLAVYAVLFGGPSLFDFYWFRVGAIFVAMIATMAVLFWPERD
ncbi:hypothetical protein H7Q97_20195 [Ochrobactrum sp. CM-21-5]|nr:hypothetical protein [Ochrobactrum sp. CM-21-5]MBC2887702.1 hypothetical protein [Ochrobactrum sp. CM-21-5]